jgi:hypothetical protein
LDEAKQIVEFDHMTTGRRDELGFEEVERPVLVQQPMPTWRCR